MMGETEQRTCKDYSGNHVMVNKESGFSLGENWNPAKFKLDVRFFFFLNLILDFLLSPHILLRSVALYP